MIRAHLPRTVVGYVSARSLSVAVGLLFAFSLALSPPAFASPPNDTFADAQALTGPAGTIAGLNIEATAEPGEPDHAGSSAGGAGAFGGQGVRSVWYRWTAPATAPTTFSLRPQDGGQVDYLATLAVYTGPAVNMLVAVSALNAGCCGAQSFVQFSATAGTVYRIAVAGLHNDSADSRGHFTLAYPADASARYLTVTTSGSGAGTVRGPGIDCGGGPTHTDCSQGVTAGTTIPLRAIPAAASSTFAGFHGGGCGDVSTFGDDCAVTMDVNKSVDAAFPLAQRTLTVSTSYKGIVVGPGITCGGGYVDCSEIVPHGTTIQLEARPTSNASKFSSFSGGGCGTASPCTVTMDNNKSVNAAFVQTMRTLTVFTSGGGRGTVTSPVGSRIDCGDGARHIYCTTTVPDGTKIELRANPASNSDFAGFAGGGCRQTSPCTVTMDDNKSVDAAFPVARRTLTVKTAGQGIGTVTGKGIDCGPIPGHNDCSETVPDGTGITLTADPLPRSFADGFDSNSGFYRCNRRPTTECTVLMERDSRVVVGFRPCRRLSAIEQSTQPWLCE